MAETLAREGSKAVPKGTLGQRVHWHREHRQEFKRGETYGGPWRQVSALSHALVWERAGSKLQGLKFML